MVSILNKCLPTEEPSEEALIASAKAGDNAAIDKLTEINYEPLFLRVKDELCQGNGKLAEDILQQAFLEVVSKLSQVGRKAPFSESVMQAARNYIVDQDTQAHARYETVSEFLAWESPTLRNQPDNDTPEAVLSRREEDLQRYAALESFIALTNASMGHKAGLRYLFTMCERNLTIPQIAEMEKKTPKQIQDALNNTCQYLRNILRPCAPG